MEIWKLFSQLFRHELARVLGVLLLSTAVILSSVGLFMLSSYVISFTGVNHSLVEVMVPVVGIRFFGLARGIFRYLERLISHHTTFRLLGALRNRLYQHISSFGMNRLIKLDKDRAFKKLIDDISMLEDFYLRTGTPYIVGIIIGLIGALLISVFSKPAGLLFSSFYSVSIILVPYIIFVKTKKPVLDLAKLAERSKGLILDMISGLADVLVNDDRDQIKNRILDGWDEEERLEGIEDKWKALGDSAIQILMHLSVLGVLWVGIVAVSNGRLEPLILPPLLYGVQALYEGVLPLPLVFQTCLRSNESIKNINQLLDIKEEATSFVISRQENSIRIQDAYGGYDPGKSILKEINLEMKEGDKLAVIGASGSGKTTLSLMMMGWLEPSRGRVVVPGNSGQSFGVVDQKVHFFNTTIKNNLRLANRKLSDRDMNKLMEEVELSSWIAGLKDGLDTELGGGDLKLSGGQKQRLALARALAKDAPFLLLDEITAGIDIDTEDKIMKMVLDHYHDKGIIVLTHRLIQMEKYDKIILLEKGRIVEEGKHEELMAKNGRYYKYYLLQSMEV